MSMFVSRATAPSIHSVAVRDASVGPSKIAHFCEKTVHM